MTMRRRDVLAALGGAAVARPWAARAQKPPARIGFLASGAAASINGRTAAFADRDARASLIEALVFRALGRSAAADDALARTRRLAGDRAFAELGREADVARNP